MMMILFFVQYYYLIFCFSFPTRSFAFFLPTTTTTTATSSSLLLQQQQFHYSWKNTKQQHQHYYYHQQLHLISNNQIQEHRQILPIKPHHQKPHDDDPIRLQATITNKNNNNNNNCIIQQKATVGDEQDYMVIDEEDEDDETTYQIAFRNTILSIIVSIIFGTGLWIGIGSDVGKEFFAGYIVEKSLSVDNLFVFLLLFDYFQIPSGHQQNRILTWGIYGSIIMRSIMIGLGATALHNFRPILLVFASILIYSSIQVLIDVEDEISSSSDDDNNLDLESNPVIQLSRFICNQNEYCDIDDFDDAATTSTNNGSGGGKSSSSASNNNPIILFTRSLIPSTSELDGDRFFITTPDGIKKATPLFVCMIAIELSDVVFAVDSIPAVFGVTENPLVVFSSNMFAILGLRSLYPVLSKAVNDLKYLESAVAVILAFIGGKMILEYFDYEPITTETALAVIIALLCIGVVASMLDKNKNNNNSD